MKSAVFGLKGKSDKWYFEEAMGAMSGATHTDWVVRIAPRICLRAGSIDTAGYAAVLLYNTGIFAVPIHTFGSETSAVLRAQHIYWKMVRKLGNAPKTNKGGVHG